MTKHGWSAVRSVTGPARALAVLAVLAGCAEVEVGAEMIKVIRQTVADGSVEGESVPNGASAPAQRSPASCRPEPGPIIGPPPKPVPSDLDPCVGAASR